LLVAGGGGVGPRGPAGGPAALGFSFFCFMKIALPRAKWALGTAVSRVWALAHGRAAFAGPAVLGALC
jgi:hypothetical protein